MSEATLSWLVVLGSVIAALGSLFAAIAAFRSASIAKKSADRADQLAYRQLRKDVMIAAQKIIAETVRINSLGQDLALEYDTLAAFTGANGSRLEVFKGSIDQKRRNAGEMQQKALEWLEQEKAEAELTEENLSKILIEFEGSLVHVLRVKEGLEREFQSIRDQNRIYREQAARK
ncbi:MAG: hypothetical protein MJA83_08310 [Gammaproteobacteria bacterium]|nr:hypothetical protein [Gammaproteobacteria bacterium]